MGFDLQVPSASCREIRPLSEGLRKTIKRDHLLLVNFVVTAQVAGSDQPSRSSAIRRTGSPISVWRISQPCFLAVERTDRTAAKSFAPSSERKPPEIFFRSFIIRPSRSARLLVNGTRGLVRNRSTSGLRTLRRNSRL